MRNYYSLQLGRTVCGFPCGGQRLGTHYICSQEADVNAGVPREAQPMGMVQLEWVLRSQSKVSVNARTDTPTGVFPR